MDIECTIDILYTLQYDYVLSIEKILILNIDGRISYS